MVTPTTKIRPYHLHVCISLRVVLSDTMRTSGRRGLVRREPLTAGVSNQLLSRTSGSASVDGVVVEAPVPGCEPLVRLVIVAVTPAGLEPQVNCASSAVKERSG